MVSLEIVQIQKDEIEKPSYNNYNIMRTKQMTGSYVLLRKVFLY